MRASDPPLTTANIGPVGQRRYLSTQRMAELLGCSANSLRIRVHRNKLPAYKFGGRLYFDPDEINELIQAGRIQQIV